jgi:UDPglucose 6-dehydrogenase/GDP-mannose 6-dehydrogenase
MIKYASNCLLATQISAVNELANISSAIKNIDIMEVIQGVHLDKRWNPINSSGGRVSPEILTYLIPGCGFGGSCLPKDLEALQSQSKEYGVEPRVIEAVIRTNEQQPSQVTKLLKESLEKLEEKSILVLGLAFKPGTSDIRKSVSIDIIQDLLEQGCFIYAHDPMAIENMKEEFGNRRDLEFIDNWEDSLEDIDAVVIATGWEDYENLSNSEIKLKMKNKILLDARRLFSDKDFPESKYLTIGRSFNNDIP